MASRSGIGKVLEGFGNEVGKRDVPGGAAALPTPETGQEVLRSIMEGNSCQREEYRRGGRPDHISHAC